MIASVDVALLSMYPVASNVSVLSIFPENSPSHPALSKDTENLLLTIFVVTRTPVGMANGSTISSTQSPSKERGRRAAFSLEGAGRRGASAATLGVGGFFLASSSRFNFASGANPQFGYCR